MSTQYSTGEATKFLHTLERGRKAEGERSAAEQAVRIDLAAAYQLAAMQDWDDIIYTHMSVRVPDHPDQFLLNPFGLTFEEITASTLVKVDEDGAIVGQSVHRVNAAGFVIHSAVHQARPELHCVIHLHTEAGMALSMLEEGLLPLSQHALMFHGRIGYHDYEGIALDMDERQRLIRDLGEHRVLVLRNHGLLTAGSTVAEAWLRMYYLEKAARTQLMAMAATRNLCMPAPEVCALTAQQHNGFEEALGVNEWPALLRRLDRLGNRYRE